LLATFRETREARCQGDVVAGHLSARRLFLRGATSDYVASREGCLLASGARRLRLARLLRVAWTLFALAVPGAQSDSASRRDYVAWRSGRQAARFTRIASLAQRIPQPHTRVFLGYGRWIVLFGSRVHTILTGFFRWVHYQLRLGDVIRILGIHILHVIVVSFYNL